MTLQKASGFVRFGEDYVSDESFPSILQILGVKSSVLTHIGHMDFDTNAP